MTEWQPRAHWQISFMELALDIEAHVGRPLPAGKFVTKLMHYVAALHLVPNQIKIRCQINTVLTPAVAWTRP